MSDGNGQRTFVGPGFGTLQAQGVPGARSTPPVVSRRAILRRGMPSIYHETDFAMRFVGALEGVLDPIAAVLDTLPEHFSPDYASRPMIDMLAAWLGVQNDEDLALDARRETVRMAAYLGRWRGTVRWSLDGALAKVEPARFVVYVDTPIPEDRQVAVARCIEHHKPVQATYKLRIKAPKTGSD
jgi:phage tail-like protein